MSEPQTPAEETPEVAPEVASEANPETPEVEELRIRRAPKLGVFLVVGGVLGALGTLILTSLYPVDPNIGFAVTFGYFCVFGVPFGVLVGALIGLALDRRSRRLVRTVSVEHEHVD